MTSELIPDEELSRWLGSDHVADLAAFAQQRIDALYLRVGADRPRPELFAEKCLPEGNVPQLLWELYPDAREVFLVRDFRDMLCSIRAFNQQRGRSSFGLESGDTDEAGYVRRVLAPSVERLLAEWRARADRAHLIRYEDLIARPADTLRAALAYLGVDSSSERARETLAQASAPIPGMAAHSTAADPAASVGRWRHELEPAQREVCEAAFGDALDEFGYER